MGVKYRMWIKATGCETRDLILYEVKDPKDTMDFKLRCIKSYVASFVFQKVYFQQKQETWSRDCCCYFICFSTFNSTSISVIHWII